MRKQTLTALVVFSSGLLLVAVAVAQNGDPQPTPQGVTTAHYDAPSDGVDVFDSSPSNSDIQLTGGIDWSAGRKMRSILPSRKRREAAAAQQRQHQHHNHAGHNHAGHKQGGHKQGGHNHADHGHSGHNHAGHNHNHAHHNHGQPNQPQPAVAKPAQRPLPTTSRRSVLRQYDTAEAATQEAAMRNQETIQNRLSTLQSQDAMRPVAALETDEPTLAEPTPAGPRSVLAEPAPVVDEAYQPIEKRESVVRQEPEPLKVAPVEAEPQPVVAEPQPAAAKPEVEAPAPAGDKPLLLTLSGPQLNATAAGPRRIVVGKPAEFVVTMRNTGNVEANELVVTVNLPTWIEVAGTRPSRGHARVADEAAPTQPLEWRINRLDAGGEEKLNLTIVPRRSLPIDLAVRWTYAQTGTHAQVEVEEPLLQIAINGPDEVLYGQTKFYNLTISNPGNGDAEDVIVHLLPLAGNNESVARHKVGRLAAGASKAIQIELSAGKAGLLAVRAQATAAGGLKSDATKEVAVRRANLVVEVTGAEARYAGTEATYDVRIANTGDATAEDLTVTAMLPPEAEYISGGDDGRWDSDEGRVQWKLHALPAGHEQTIRVRCLLTAGGPNELRVRAVDRTDLTSVGTVTTDVIARADLKLEIDDPQGPVATGDVAVYDLRIRNRGTEVAEQVDVVAFFSEGVEPIGVEGIEHEISPGQVVFRTIPRLIAGGEIVLKVRAQADRPGDHVFRAEVVCPALGTKLAAEETTHFYGREVRTAAAPRQAVPLVSPDAVPLVSPDAVPLVAPEGVTPAE